MTFQEPKVEFVKLTLDKMMTGENSPGAGYNVCEKQGISGMDQEGFCANMNIAGMPLD